MLPRWAQYSLHMLHSSMQQGWTVCKRQSNVSSQGPLPARSDLHGQGGAHSLQPISEGKVFSSLPLHRETCFMAVQTHGLLLRGDGSAPQQHQQLRVTYWDLKRSARMAVTRPTFGAMCHTLHIPASLKQLACHGVTSRDTWLLAQHCRTHAHTLTWMHAPRHRELAQETERTGEIRTPA